MSIVEPTSRAVSANGYIGRHASSDERQIRDAVETWGRQRWSDSRCCHELTVGHGKSRADVAFVQPNHFATIEIKSQRDNTSRLITQVALFRLASPETWIVTVGRHLRDAELMRYLIPSIGIAQAVPADPARPFNGDLSIVVVAEPTPFRAEPECMLSVLWVAELQQEAVARRVWFAKPGTHAALVRALLKLPEPEQVAAVCRQLRARDAVWRADPPVPALPVALGLLSDVA